MASSLDPKDGIDFNVSAFETLYDIGGEREPEPGIVDVTSAHAGLRVFWERVWRISKMHVFATTVLTLTNSLLKDPKVETSLLDLLPESPISSGTHSSSSNSVSECTGNCSCEEQSEPVAGEQHEGTCDGEIE